jgi:hypothetical protein
MEKEFKVILQSIGPVGDIIQSKELSMFINDEPGSMIDGRLFLYLGDCLYFIDKKGFIKDRVIPKDDTPLCEEPNWK